ncbi:unnamed protein product [Cochlearia groenlandica]
MSVSASSLSLSSFNPKSLLHKPASFSVSLPSLSFKLQPLNLVSKFASSTVKLTSTARFVRNVAVSSDFDVEEEDMFADDDDSSSPPPPSQRSSFSADLKIFVGNLSFNVDSAQLAQLFESAGNVEMVEVIYDKETGRSRGFGFVTMSNASEVEAAAQQFNGYEFEGRPLRVNAGPPPPKREESFSRGPRSGSGSGSSDRVYVGNLSWGVDDMALESLFSEKGKVVEARVIYDRDTGRSKGFGFVTLGSPQEVQNAISSLNGADLDGRQIRVSEAEAKPPRRQF